MWVATVLICFNPSALSCQVVANPESFYNEQACMEDAQAEATRIIQNDIYAIPKCFQVGTTL